MPLANLRLTSSGRICRREPVGGSVKVGIAQEDFEEGDAMNWLEDDEMMRQWEEVSKEEGETTGQKKRS